jgi:hypothetical protein
MNVRISWLTLILISTPSLVFATALPAINNYLVAAQAELDTVNATRKHIPDLNGVSSWVDEAQIRISNDDQYQVNNDRNVNSQSYGLRIKPKAYGQRDAEQKILRLRASQEDAQYTEALNTELSRRYAQILELISQQNQTRFLLESDTLLNKQVQLNRNLANSTEFNEENLLDVEMAFEQTNDLVELNLHRLQDLQSQLNLPVDSKEAIIDSKNTLDWLVSVPQMHDIMAKTIAPQHVPDVIKSQLELEQAKAERQHKKSTQQLGINLLRFQLDDSDNVDRDIKLGFMVGVNIPLGTENFQTTETHHDIYDARFKLHDSTYTTTQSLNEKRVKMKWLKEEWNVTEKQLDRLNTRLQKDYAKINPQLALALQIEHAKKFKELLDIHQEALTIYLNYLSLSGQLTSLPLRNWLHTDIPALRPIASTKTAVIPPSKG